VAGVDQGLQRVERATAAQVRVAAAEDQLLGLDVELDLADAAAPQLEVGALGRSGVSSTLWAWIWRLIEWMSAMEAKSRFLRQTKGGKLAQEGRSRRRASPAQAAP
jgi:hypothetical protein